MIDRVTINQVTWLMNCWKHRSSHPKEPSIHPETLIAANAREVDKVDSDFWTQNISLPTPIHIDFSCSLQWSLNQSSLLKRAVVPTTHPTPTIQLNLWNIDALLCYWKVAGIHWVAAHCLCGWNLVTKIIFTQIKYIMFLPTKLCCLNQLWAIGSIIVMTNKQCMNWILRQWKTAKFIAQRINCSQK